MNQQEIISEALTVPERAKVIVIRSNDDYLQAADVLSKVKALRREINAAFDPIIEKAYAAHKEAVGQKKKADVPLVEAEGIIKPRLAEWDREQERIRMQAQREAQEAARKAQEEARLAEAIAAEAEGAKEEAQAIIDAPPPPPPIVIVPKSIPKIEGLSYREVWKFRVKNLADVPREYMAVDEIKIGAVVRAMKGQTNIAGIEVYSERVTSSR